MRGPPLPIRARQSFASGADGSTSLPCAPLYSSAATTGFVEAIAIEGALFFCICSSRAFAKWRRLAFGLFDFAALRMERFISELPLVVRASFAALLPLPRRKSRSAMSFR